MFMCAPDCGRGGGGEGLPMANTVLRGEAEAARVTKVFTGSKACLFAESQSVPENGLEAMRRELQISVKVGRMPRPWVILVQKPHK